jgi:hypothetical protein
MTYDRSFISQASSAWFESLLDGAKRTALAQAESAPAIRAADALYFDF